MGKIATSAAPPGATTATHFSHPHPLKLQSHHPNPSSLCGGCRLKPSGSIYSCTHCDFFLHKKCFDMPNKITHPCHRDHTFTLLPRPAYADGLFQCDACAKKGDGFSYHCKLCSIDLHIHCAALPLSVTNPRHIHKLELNYQSPYFDKEFCCDICNCHGSNHWLYRCNSCGFDAHLDCATTPPVQQSPLPQNFTPFRPQAPVHGFGQQFMGQRPPFMQSGSAAFGVPAGGPVMPNVPAGGPVMPNVPAGRPVMPNLFELNRQRNEVFLQTMQQIINNNNAITQAMLPGGGGGFGYACQGGAGGDYGMQQLMQLNSGIQANGGNFGAGGSSAYQDYFLQSLMNSGGAGGQEYLQALMNAGGGGAGGQEYLQALMNAGGGGAGGQEYLQALMNAGGGGAGGQEYLQALMNSGAGGGGGGGMEFLQSLMGGGGCVDFLSGALGG